jgi:hypothetical protein
LPAAPGRAETGPPASIVRISLPDEAGERQPVALPTEPENTIEIDFPWPVEDWAGRGFTPDAEKFAGDLVVEAARGKERIFVTPVAAGAHRVLDVILSQPDGRSRGVPLEFVPAPAGLAWRKVVFVDGAAPPAPRTAVGLSGSAPRPRLREASPEAQIGLITTLRLMLNATADGARDVAAANPALDLEELHGPPRSFGDFTIANRFALRDSTTGMVGICASVANETSRRLLFDPQSWVVRVGDRVYPVRTMDFAGELEPGSTAPVFLVLARGPDGAPTLLLAENAFEISALVKASINPRPVMLLPIAGFDSR